MNQKKYKVTKTLSIILIALAIFIAGIQLGMMERSKQIHAKFGQFP